MSSNRPNLTLDEQSFQGLLSAAFTIQEHNDRRRQARPAPGHSEPEFHPEPEVRPEPKATPVANHLCPHCGASKPDVELACDNCGQHELRPGERLQRNWASMWLKSQEQGLWPERAQEILEGASNPVAPRPADSRPRAQAAPKFATGGFLGTPPAKRVAQEIPPQQEAASIPDRAPSKSEPKDPIVSAPVPGRTLFDKPALDKEEPGTEGPAAFAHGLREDDLPEYDLAQNDLTHEDETQEDLARPDSTQHDFARSAFTRDDVTRDEWARNLPPSDSHLGFPTFQLSANDNSLSAEVWPEAGSGARFDAESYAKPEAGIDAGPSSAMQRFLDLRVKLRFRRADLYLGTAIFVAAVALLWPAAGSPRTAKPSLSVWEQALVSLGIAEAPAPEVHLQGDPGIQVWIDPHTALYYCPGEEQYGKAANGRLSTQREAQMDRFEPAGRSPCE